MRITKILNSKQIKHTTFKEAQNTFYRHCVIRNLSEQTLRYYKEDLPYFHNKVLVKYIDYLTQEAFDDFLFNELEEGKRSFL